MRKTRNNSLYCNIKFTLYPRLGDYYAQIKLIISNNNKVLKLSS